MEFSCSKGDLYQGVQTTERIVATRSTLPIIGNILLETVDSALKMSANNLELGIEILVPAKIGQTGAILVPAKTFNALVGKLPEAPLSFKVSDKGIIKLTYKQSSLSIYGLSPDEFPMLPRIKEGQSFKADKELLANLIKQTVFAVSTSEDKYVLSGVLMEVGKAPVENDSTNLRLVATDGYRLARSAAKIDLPAGIEGKAIIPQKALAELLRGLTQEKKGELKVTLAADQIAFEIGSTYLVSRLIQGQFPDYRQVIPKKSDSKITLETAGFLQAAERSAVIAASSANIVKLEVKDKKMHLVASTPDVGAVDEVLDAEIAGTGKTQIAFNVRLLIDALRIIEAEKVCLELSGPLSPGILRPSTGSDYLYIVMPIRTAETSA